MYACPTKMNLQQNKVKNSINHLVPRKHDFYWWLDTHKNQASRHSDHAVGKTNGKEVLKSCVLLSICL